VNKYIVQLNHPAHFHLFKNIIYRLRNDGHNVLVTNRSKDVLEKLLECENNINISLKYSRGINNKCRNLINREFKLNKIIVEYRPSLLLGTSPEIAHLGFLNKIPSIFFGEDDVDLSIVMKLGAYTCYPFFSHILSPTTCNNSIWNKKTTKYYGYHELAYLHPNHFKPDKEIVGKYISQENPYFIIRFAKLTAYHDKGINGINTEIAQNIINLLKQNGSIYITSERELEPQFEKYRIQINPLNMHHVLAFASLYIGDSQTMAAEAGVLGTPFIRYNDFVGRIGYLNELENRYELGYGFKTNETQKMYEKIKDLLKITKVKNIFQKRRNKMLIDKIDFAAFSVWFIENYPESVKIMKENPDYQLRFK